jgi:hypothetical protein
MCKKIRSKYNCLIYAKQKILWNVEKGIWWSNRKQLHGFAIFRSEQLNGYTLRLITYF